MSSVPVIPPDQSLPPSPPQHRSEQSTHTTLAESLGRPLKHLHTQWCFVTGNGRSCDRALCSRCRYLYAQPRPLLLILYPNAPWTLEVRTRTPIRLRITCQPGRQLDSPSPASHRNGLASRRPEVVRLVFPFLSDPESFPSVSREFLAGGSGRTGTGVQLKPRSSLWYEKLAIEMAGGTCGRFRSTGYGNTSATGALDMWTATNIVILGLRTLIPATKSDSPPRRAVSGEQI